MSDTISIHDLIYNTAIAQGVDPAIALAVAQKESGTNQWLPSGDVIRGTSGEYGVFQLMPETAAQLGVDPTDLQGNITGGITFLGQLFNKYGNWNQALSAYNSGNPNSKATTVLGYVASVLGLANGYARQLTQVAAAGGPSSGLSVSDVLGSVSGPGTSLAIIGGLLLGAAALAWWFWD